jgi:hypothetical protein
MNPRRKDRVARRRAIRATPERFKTEAWENILQTQQRQIKREAISVARVAQQLENPAF